MGEWELGQRRSRPDVCEWSHSPFSFQTDPSGLTRNDLALQWHVHTCYNVFLFFFSPLKKKQPPFFKKLLYQLWLRSSLMCNKIWIKCLYTLTPTNTIAFVIEQALTSQIAFHHVTTLILSQGSNTFFCFQCSEWMRKLSIPKFLIVNLCSVCVELMHLTVTAFFFLREGKKNY